MLGGFDDMIWLRYIEIYWFEIKIKSKLDKQYKLVLMIDMVIDLSNPE